MPIQSPQPEFAPNPNGRIKENSVRIGVRISQGVLEAHAWIEHAGILVNDRPDVSTDFVPLSEPVSPRFFPRP